MLVYGVNDAGCLIIFINYDIYGVIIYIFDLFFLYIQLMKYSHLIFLLLLASVNLPAQTHDLSLKLEKGQEFRQHMVNSSLISQTVMGREVEMEISMESDMQYRVLACVDSLYELEVWFERLVMNSIVPEGMREVRYSSEDPAADDPIAGLLSRVVNKPFILLVNSRGVIGEIKRSAQLLHEIEQVSSEQLGYFAELFMQAFGDGSNYVNFGMLVRLPDLSVGLGDSWPGNDWLSSGIPVNATATYTLVGVNDDSFVIRGRSIFSSTIETWAKAPDFDLKLNGDIISEIVLHRETGLVQSASHIQDMKGNGTFQPPQGDHPIEMAMHMLTSIQISGQ